MSTDEDAPTPEQQPRGESFPPPSGGRGLAYAQLLRIPNIFTAWANIVMGFFVANGDHAQWLLLALLLAASSCLYFAGMVLNDVFDIEIDRRQRPERPIPSGRVSWQTAKGLGFGLLLAGVGLALAASFLHGQWRPLIVALLLAGCILLYDGWAKKTPAGGLAMGGCRLLNVLLGMSVAVTAAGEPRSWNSLEWTIAVGIGIYVAGLTRFARSEAETSKRTQLGGALLVVLIGIGMLALLPLRYPIPPALPGWMVFWGVIALTVIARCGYAILNPSPQRVQAAVKSMLMTLIMLDAAVCFGYGATLPAIVIAAMLLPMTWLGRFVYST